MLDDIMLALIVIPFTAVWAARMYTIISYTVFHLITFPILCLAKFFFMLIWILSVETYEEYVKDHKLSFITGCGLGLVFTSQWFY